MRFGALSMILGVMSAAHQVSAACPGGAVGQGVACSWREGFHRSDPDGEILSLAVYDDGSGPQLYAGGSFTTAGKALANGIARWDDDAWRSLGGAGVGAGGRVQALAVYDDGNSEALFLGGRFDTVAGIVANGIARWDGTAFSVLAGPSGVGVSREVTTMVVHDDGSGRALYVGGYLDTAGGVAVQGVARWDGTRWTGLQDQSGTKMWSVTALGVLDVGNGEALYAGGMFQRVTGELSSFARWDGTSWTVLDGPTATGYQPRILTMAVYDSGAGPALFVGGSFGSAGETVVANVARWDGTAWYALADASRTGSDDTVRALAVADDGAGEALFVGGGFGWYEQAGETRLRLLGRWDGVAWSVAPGPSGTVVRGGINALAAYDDGTSSRVYAGGVQSLDDGRSELTVSRWDGLRCTALPGVRGAGLDRDVSSLVLWDDGSGPALYAGGRFRTAGSVTVNGIARWGQGVWQPLLGTKSGVSGEVEALSVYDDGSGAALYVAGALSSAGGVPVNNVARWDGASWSALDDPVGPRLDGHVYALAVFDDGTGPALFAGGWFDMPMSVARWDGVSWRALPTPDREDPLGVYGEVYVLTVFDDGSGAALYAGGNTDFGEGQAVATNLARWDGVFWTPVEDAFGRGVEGEVRALAVFDDGVGEALYAGGRFAEAGGVTVNQVARWDGASWSALDGPLAAGVADEQGSQAWVQALTMLDDGCGPALYAGGSFTTAGGLTVNGVARWDGAAWSMLTGPLETGINGRVQALAADATGKVSRLYVGGSFTSAGGFVSSRLASWTCEPQRTLRRASRRLGVAH